jgi:hypothetical protein
MRVYILQECSRKAYEDHKDNWTDFFKVKYCYETECLYYEAEIPFMPIEGQRLGTRFGISIVEYANYEIEENPDDDFLLNKTFIKVTDE